jgi:hypothetical protein
MRITSALATGLTAAALAVPAGALADPGNGNGHANGHHRATPTASTSYHDPTPGPKASPKAKAKAYGKRCRGQSKKHVKGQQGTAFSRCVTAMAKVATGKEDNPARACKGLSKKHVKGQKGTPFSRCVVAAAKLRGKHKGGDEQYTDPLG